MRAQISVSQIAIVEQDMASHKSQKSLVNTDNSLLRSQCINASLADQAEQKAESVYNKTFCCSMQRVGASTTDMTKALEMKNRRGYSSSGLPLKSGFLVLLYIKASKPSRKQLL